MPPIGCSQLVVDFPHTHTHTHSIKKTQVKKPKCYYASTQTLPSVCVDRQFLRSRIAATYSHPFRAAGQEWCPGTCHLIPASQQPNSPASWQAGILYAEHARIVRQDDAIESRIHTTVTTSGMNDADIRSSRCVAGIAHHSRPSRWSGRTCQFRNHTESWSSQSVRQKES